MEATIICVDNSEWSRNGDYSPNRWESQQEAVNEIASKKTMQSPENSVGILSMAGTRAEVIVSPTNDMAKILQAIYEIKIQGQVDLYSSLQIAHLALKHSSKKEQAKRIVVFVCSPITHDTQKFQTLGRNLKRNNIALDIVVFGNLEESEKLHDLQQAVNSGENSHFITIPSGLGFFCDALRNTPIFQGPNAGGFEDQGAYDPSVDPELATAIRLSLEEQKRRQEDQNVGGQGNVVDGGLQTIVEEDEEALLQQALKMSIEESNKVEAQSEPPVVSSEFANQDFLNELLSSVPGVDPNDPDIKKVVEQIKNEGKKEDKEEDKKE